MRYFSIALVVLLSACTSSSIVSEYKQGNSPQSFEDVAECIKNNIRMNTGFGSLNMGPETAIAYYSDRANIVVRDVNSFDTIATIEVLKRGEGSYVYDPRFGYNFDDPSNRVESEIESSVDRCR